MEKNRSNLGETDSVHEFKNSNDNSHCEEKNDHGFDSIQCMTSVDGMYSENEMVLSKDERNDSLWNETVLKNEIENNKNNNNGRMIETEEDGGKGKGSSMSGNGRQDQPPQQPQQQQQQQQRGYVRGFSLYESEDELSECVSVYQDDKECIESDDDWSNDEDDSYRALMEAELTPKHIESIQEQLKSFVPNIITSCSEANDISSIAFNGFFLLADISGFTKLSSTLCAQGSKGLDKLRSITNNSFRSFIDIILMHGGDVIAFAGDALICVFRPKVIADDDNIATSTDEQIGHKGLAAIACAKEICNTILNGVQIHCGITYGSMCAAILGGFRSQYAAILNGKCTEEIGQVLDSAGPNEVVISAVVFDLVREYLNYGSNESCSGDDTVESLISLDKKATVFKVLVKPSFEASLAGVTEKMLSIGRRESRKHAPSPSSRHQVSFIAIVSFQCLYFAIFMIRDLNR
jgi:class 3 adenylate cyclase